MVLLSITLLLDVNEGFGADAVMGVDETGDPISDARKLTEENCGVADLAGGTR
jgi:hypothetical protein